MKILFIVLTIGLSPTAALAFNSCALPEMNLAAGATASGGDYTARISMGQVVGGASTSTLVSLAVGLQSTSLGGYACFLSTDTPLGVAALPGTLSVERLVPSANASMTLEWTSSLNPLPVTYSVYTGTSPYALSLTAPGLAGTSQMLTTLSYNTPHSWQVIVADKFGRTAPSAVYSFSIAPVVNHLIAAPNPFHPEQGGTTLLFAMSGQGSALIEIFSLPEGRRVFQRRIDGLQDGNNTYVYDGRDGGGRLLGNGVFSIRLTKNGANGNAVEHFKIVSVR